eukprot:m.17450 g.17450  ORF g.17450 m.17450 type:complete len:627 (-) comp3501_c0_seq1:349-2229(-)
MMSMWAESPMPLMMPARHALKSPTALATFTGTMMSRGEAFATPVGTRVLAKQDGNIFLAEIRGVDRNSGTVAITCPAWPDDEEEWVPPSRLFSRSGAAPALLAAIESKLQEATKGWKGFKYNIGDIVTVRCGEVARCTGVVTGRALRQFDIRDPARDNSHHSFVPTYLVRMELDEDAYYTEEALSPIDDLKASSSSASASSLSQPLTTAAVNSKGGGMVSSSGSTGNGTCTTANGNGNTMDTHDGGRSVRAVSEDASSTMGSTAGDASTPLLASLSGGPSSGKKMGTGKNNGERRKKKGRGHNLSLDGKSVCRACAYGAHSAHTCGNRGKAANPATLAKQEMEEATSSPKYNHLASPTTPNGTDRTTRASAAAAAAGTRGSSRAPPASPLSLSFPSSPMMASLTSRGGGPDHAMILSPGSSSLPTVGSGGVLYRRKRTMSVDSDVRSDASAGDSPLFPSYRMRTPDNDVFVSSSGSVFHTRETMSMPSGTARGGMPQRSMSTSALLPSPRHRRSHQPPKPQRTGAAELLGLATPVAGEPTGPGGADFVGTIKRMRRMSESSETQSTASTSSPASSTKSIGSHHDIRWCAECDGMLEDDGCQGRCFTCAALEDCAVRLTLKQGSLCS